MLFHDFRSKPEDLGFIHIRGDMFCTWKPGNLTVDFQGELFTWLLFHKPVGGYEGLLIECGFSAPGKLTLEIEDIFQRCYRWKTNLTGERRELKIPWHEFDSIHSEKLQTVEKLKVYFKPESQGKHQWTVNRIEPYGIDHYGGPWISIDPLFSYYHHSDWKETAKRVKNLGFVGVEIINIQENPGIEEQKVIVDAFRAEGLLCILRIYPTTDFSAYEVHPAWRQISLDGSSGHDWRVYLCPNSKEFRSYISEKIAGMVRDAKYDALELSEPWFEVWGGAYEDNPQKGKYACFCPNCLRRFQDIAGVDARELFDPVSDTYFLKEENRELYKQWMQMRVDTIIEFCAEIYQSAKKAQKDLSIIHMHLSDCRVEPGRGREYHAQDLEKALDTLQPDALIIQDAWQDWTEPELTPDFVLDYGKYYLPLVREKHPHIKVLPHADIGSLEEMQRSYVWMRKFITLAGDIGFNGADFYEFSIGDFLP